MTDLATQVTATLGDHTADYDIPAIVADLRNAGATSIDDVDHATYDAILQRHDLAETGTGHVAWLTTSTSETDSGKPEVYVQADEGDMIPFGPTALPVTTSHRDAQADAETLLEEHGWVTVGAWSDFSDGYTISVRRDPSATA